MRTYRLLTVLSVCGCMWAAPGDRPEASRAADLSADQLLKAAREAVGGEQSLGAIKSFILKGVVTNPAGGRGSFAGLVAEFRASLPDSFLQLTRFPGMASGQGFDREAILYRMEADTGVTGSMAKPPEDFLDEWRVVFARLMLLTVLRTDTSLPLTLQRTVTITDRYVTLEFRARGGLALFLDLDPGSHLPLRLRHMVRKRVTLTGPRTGPAVDVVQTVDDRRAVSGVLWPFHMTDAQEGKVNHDYRFESVQVNPSPAALDLKHWEYRR